MSIRVLLAEAHALAREGLRLVIEEDAEMHVVASVGDGKAAIREVGKKYPAVVILDVSLPLLNGIEVTRLICGDPFSPSVLCMSATADSRLLSAALSAGASGYILRRHTGAELIRALHIVHDGGTYLSPSIANEVVAGYVAHHKTNGNASTLMQLTRREREILQLTTEGFDSHATGAQLGVSSKTVYSHLEHIMHKLDTHSVADLTRYAVREGVTAL